MNREEYIRLERRQGITMQVIGDRLGVTRQPIEQICTRNGFKVRTKESPRPINKPHPLERLLANRFITERNCWEWTGSRTPLGYGRWNGETYIHRTSFEIFKGEINDKWVLHRCDNPACFNPDHLYLGTPQDNANDLRERREIARKLNLPISETTRPLDNCKTNP